MKAPIPVSPPELPAATLSKIPLTAALRQGRALCTECGRLARATADTAGRPLQRCELCGVSMESACIAFGQVNRITLSMYAKIFTQILDSSIAEDYRTRHVFEDLLKLCDINGVVDMTQEAIARRTNVPLEIIVRGIADLEKPDPRSRNSDHQGRRIIRLNECRDWGWSITNYDLYRQIASEEQRREKTKARVQRLRQSRQQPNLPNAGSVNAPVTPCNAPAESVTPCNASNAMQREMERDYDKASVPTPDPSSSVPSHGPTKATKPKKLSIAEKEIADRFETALSHQWVNDAGKWIRRIQGVGAEGTTPKEVADAAAAMRCKCRRVIDEVENAIKEGRIHTTPAQYAEEQWKRFA